MIAAPQRRDLVQAVLEDDGGAAGAGAGQVQAVTAHVVQRAGHLEATVVVGERDGLHCAADGGDGHQADGRVQQPPRPAGRGAARGAHHPDGQDERGRRPHPAGRGEGAVVGGDGEQGDSGDGHHGGRDGGPALRLAGPPGREHREQRPAGGQADEARAGDDGLGGAGEHDQDEKEGGDQAAEHGAGDHQGERDPPPGGRRGVGGDVAAAAVGRGVVVVMSVSLPGRWCRRAGRRYSFSVGATGGGRPGRMTGFRQQRRSVGRQRPRGWAGGPGLRGCAGREVSGG